MSKLTFDSKLNPEYMAQIAAIDVDAYGATPDPAILPIATNFPELYRVLRRGNQVLGYTLAIPLKSEIFHAMKNGEAWEQDITVENVDPSAKGLYIASIASARNRRAFLSGTLVGVLGEKAMVFDGEVIGTPVTRTGENLAKMLSFKPTGHFPQTNLPFSIKPQVWARQ